MPRPRQPLTPVAPPEDGAAPASKRLVASCPSFRHNKKARSTSFEWLNGLTEDDAYELFKQARFVDNDGNPVCPFCSCKRHYAIKRRPRQFKCADSSCGKQFSVTSGTIFHSRKLSFLKLVKMTFEFAGCSKGEAALRQTQKLKVEVKSVWVNLMKMREAMAARRDEVVLGGIVEMDAVWIGGKARKLNDVAKQKERANAETTGTGENAYRRGKRAVMVVRERGGDSVMFAADAETPGVAMSAVMRLTMPGTVIVTDQSPAYAKVGDIRPHETINHEVAFCEDGISSNWAEGELARIRRAHYGIHHYFSPKYLDFYAGEMAWREDRRFTGNKEQATEILTRCLAHPVSRHFKGYWQNYHQHADGPDLTEIRWARVPGAAARHPFKPVVHVSDLFGPVTPATAPQPVAKDGGLADPVTPAIVPQPVAKDEGPVAEDNGPVTVREAKAFSGSRIPKPPAEVGD